MKEVALVTFITERGEDIILEAHLNFDKAHKRVAELIEITKDANSYYTQYVQLI